MKGRTARRIVDVRMVAVCRISERAAHLPEDKECVVEMLIGLRSDCSEGVLTVSSNSWAREVVGSVRERQGDMQEEVK